MTGGGAWLADAALASDLNAPLRLVHLVRQVNGPEPLERFLDSYREHDAGVEHQLVLLFKGFESQSAATPYRERAGELDAEAIFVHDEGFDLDAYLTAAAELGAGRYCFVNSFSRVLAAGWLRQLDDALHEPRVGLVGATGSWASARSYMYFALGLPSAYRAVYPSRRETRAEFRRVEEARTGETGGSLLTIARRKAATARALAELAVGFQRFPAHHIRTNAFATTSGVLQALTTARLRRKVHAYRLEHGRRSFTRQVELMELRAVVTGRDGVIYGRDDWAESETFWQGEQANLLIADNQTERYAHGDLATRELLARFAWGSAARPTLPEI